MEYVTTWYTNNLTELSAHIDTWREDYDPESNITAHTVTYMYNYLLGVDNTFYEWLDLNKDGYINSTDVTDAYNFLLGIKQHKKNNSQ